jgi:hypothetical protein
MTATLQKRLRAVLTGLALCIVSTGVVYAQFGFGGSERFARGQNVVPVYEGFEQNADGTYTMYFGYLNRNYEEEVDVPIGEANSFEPGPADRGQPAHFYPRRNSFLLKVVVPADWGDKEVIWTLSSRGKTEKARGKLLPSWVIDEGVMRGNRGSRGDLGDVGKDYEVVNTPPSITLEGPAQRTVSVSESVSFTVFITDDGAEPQPPWLKDRQARRAQRSQGDQPTRPGAPAAGSGARATPLPPSVQLRVEPVVRPPAQGQRPGVTWTHHRGEAGKVTFSNMYPRLENGRATVTARFSAPGTYVLRAYADDGVRMTPMDVTVTVTPAAASATSGTQ